MIIQEFPNIKTLFENGYSLSYLEKVIAIKAFKEAAPLTNNIRILKNMKLMEQFINKNVKKYNKHNLGFNICSRRKVMERRLIENHMKIDKTNRFANQMLYRY